MMQSRFVFMIIALILLLTSVEYSYSEKNNFKVFERSEVSQVSMSGVFNVVEIVQADKDKVVIEYSQKDDKQKGIEVFTENNVLCIRNTDVNSIQKADNITNIAIGNSKSTITVGNKVVSSSEDVPAANIVLHCPEKIDFEASGIFRLFSSIPLNKIDLKLLSGGSAKIVESESGNVVVECVGDAHALVSGVQDASVAIKAVGGARTEVEGSFQSVSVESVGANELQISGPVSGDYSVSIVGKGLLTHTGTIVGRVNTFVTGSGRFDHIEK